MAGEYDEIVGARLKRLSHRIPFWGGCSVMARIPWMRVTYFEDSKLSHSGPNDFFLFQISTRALKTTFSDGPRELWERRAF